MCVRCEKEDEEPKIKREGGSEKAKDRCLLGFVLASHNSCDLSQCCLFPPSLNPRWVVRDPS